MYSVDYDYALHHFLQVTRYFADPQTLWVKNKIKCHFDKTSGKFQIIRPFLDGVQLFEVFVNLEGISWRTNVKDRGKKYFRINPF